MMSDKQPEQFEKPSDIVYGLLDRPPFLTTLSLAIQQLFVIFPYLVLVSVIAKAAHASTSVAASLISLTLIAMGIGTALQALHKGPIGAGYLAVACPMPNYLQPSIAAVHTGGLSLMAGMVLFSGVCQTVIAMFLKKIRFLFPNVLTGLVFCMIGIDMGKIGLQQIILVPDSLYSAAFAKHIFCFAVTFSLIVIFNVWGRGLLRLLCSSIGLVIGSILALFLGLYLPDKLAQLHTANWFALPQIVISHYSFDPALIFVFLISSIASVLRATGAITTAQEMNDANWHRADQQNLKKGLFADGLTAILGGAVGTTGLGCTPSSVGLSKASGATSRWIAYMVALLCFILAFCPKLGALFFALPSSVIAAGLLFVSCILFTGGIRIIAVQEIDARKTFIICVSLFAGLSTQFFPTFYQQFPAILQPIVTSLLSLGTIVAFLLNLVFRLGIKRTERLVFDQADEEFSKTLKQKINQLHIKANIAEAIINSFTRIANLIITGRHNKNPITGTLSYDELDFIVSLRYEGSLITLPTKKNFASDDLSEENAFIEGISTLYRDFSPDRVEYTSKDDIVTIRMNFVV